VGVFLILSLIKTFSDVRTIKEESIQEQRKRELLKEQGLAT
jgi:hypothetical protein